MVFPLFFGLLLLLCLFILFIPLRISFYLEVFPGIKSTSVRITSWKDLCGVEFVREEGNNCFNGILMRKSMIWKKWSWKKDEEERIRRKVSQRSKKTKRIWCIVARTFHRFPVFFRRVLENFDLERLDVRGDFGVGDPALTGTIYGFIQALQQIPVRVVHTTLVPDFAVPKFEGKIALILRCILFRLLWSVFRTTIELGWAYEKCRS